MEIDRWADRLQIRDRDAVIQAISGHLNLMFASLHSPEQQRQLPGQECGMDELDDG